MELNKKCLDILSCLRQQEDYVTVGQLAEKYNISERGIRYNLDKIERYLALQNMPYLDKERGRGIRLHQSDRVYSFIDSIVGTIRPYKYNYSLAERQAFLQILLLASEQPLTTEFFCKYLECSRNTVFSDMQEAEKWLEAKGAALVRKPRVGIYVDYDEMQRRMAIKELLLENIPQENLFQYLMEGTSHSKLSLLILENLISHGRAAQIVKTIMSIESLLQRHFSDETFANLAIHMIILLCRAECGSLDIDISNEDNITFSEEYSVTRRALGELELQTGKSFSTGELLYFTYNLLGAKVIKHGKTQGTASDMGLMAVTRRMLADIEHIYSVDFGEQREEIVRGIFLHLGPAVHRIKYKLQSQNPLYKEVVLNYKELFINTRIVCQHLEKYINAPVSDNEVAYIALHFGAALYRANKRTNTKARILLVCGTGLSSAKMITSQIDKLFNVEIVDAVSSRKAMEMDKSGIDYIITTVPMKEDEGPKHIRVSPMFSEKDQQLVSKYLSQNFIPKEHYHNEVFMANRLIEIVEKYGVITDKIRMQFEFLNELINSGSNDFNLARDELMLSDLLIRENIELGVSCKSWRESIILGSRILEEKGYIRPCYKDKIIANLERFGPYMVMIPGVVFAHASTEDGVNRLGMSMSVLKNPVSFGYQEHDPVSIVVTLSAIDDKKHLKAMAQLFRMLKNTDGFKTATTGTKDEIVELISKYSI